MYTQTDVERIQKMDRNFRIGVCVAAGIGLAAFVVCTILRLHVAGYVLAAVLAIGMTLAWGLFGMPIRAYKRFLAEVFAGKARIEQGIVLAVGEELNIQNGLEMRDINFLDDEDAAADREKGRLLLFDWALGEFPAKPGQRVELELRGSYIKELRILDEKPNA